MQESDENKTSTASKSTHTSQTTNLDTEPQITTLEPDQHQSQIDQSLLSSQIPYTHTFICNKVKEPSYDLKKVVTSSKISEKKKSLQTQESATVGSVSSSTSET